MEDELYEVDQGNGYVDLYYKWGENDMPYLWNAKGDCKHIIVSSSGGGVKCENCSGWCCF